MLVTASNTTSPRWRDKWGHGDYASEVARKERAEEEHIRKKLAKDDTDSEKVLSPKP